MISKARHRCVGVAKFTPMPGNYRLWTVRDIYRAMPTVKEDLGFCGVTWRIPHLVTFYVKKVCESEHRSSQDYLSIKLYAYE